MSRSLRSYLLISLGCCVSLIPLTAKAGSQRLFFCEATNNFYPFVQTCAVPWKEIDKAAASQPVSAPAPTQMASVLSPADTQPAQHHVVAYPIGMPPPAQTPAPAASPVALTPAVATSPASANPPEIATSQGPVIYVYGSETTPLMVCAVSQLCDLALQPGEKINHIILGDPEHWKVETLEEGSGGAETLHLIIRPSSADLATSMIVLTRARSYHVQLQSHRKDYMLQVAFTYPEAQAAAMPAPDMAAPVQPQAAVDSDDGFVKVGDITYVKGREPKSLAEPPPPAAAPRPEVSAVTP
jgi:hypothetical protein